MNKTVRPGDVSSPSQPKTSKPQEEKRKKWNEIEKSKALTEKKQSLWILLFHLKHFGLCSLELQVKQQSAKSYKWNSKVQKVIRGALTCKGL